MAIIEAQVESIGCRKDVRYACVEVPDVRYHPASDRIFIPAEDLQPGETVTIEIRRKS